MGVKIIKQLAIAWNLMWALSYLVVAFVAPGIGGNPVWLSTVVFLVFGIALLSATVMTSWAKYNATRTVGRIMLVILAVISVYSGIASWTGVALWIVPFADKALFQVSMAFADLIGAAFMLDLALEKNLT
jgi:hypothetical protein